MAEASRLLATLALMAAAAATSSASSLTKCDLNFEFEIPYDGGKTCHECPFAGLARPYALPAYIAGTDHFDYAAMCYQRFVPLVVKADYTTDGRPFPNSLVQTIYDGVRDQSAESLMMIDGFDNETRLENLRIDFTLGNEDLPQILERIVVWKRKGCESVELGPIGTRYPFSSIEMQLKLVDLGFTRRSCKISHSSRAYVIMTCIKSVLFRRLSLEYPASGLTNSSSVAADDRLACHLPAEIEFYGRRAAAVRDLELDIISN